MRRFMVYKLPENKTSTKSLVQEGFAQVYMDVNNQQWTMSEKSIDDKNHAIYYTLQQIYNGADQVSVTC